MLNIVVLISGYGSNLQAIIDCATTSNVNIQAVISNQKDAYGLKRAQRAKINTHTISHEHLTRDLFEKKLINTLNLYHPDLIVLAGFMRILSASFTQRYTGKIINIHPSLLPKFTGLNTHQRALDAGEVEHGASIHFVTEALDLGPIISQKKVNITPNDTAKTLAEKVTKAEHKLYPQVLLDFANNNINN